MNPPRGRENLALVPPPPLPVDAAASSRWLPIERAQAFERALGLALGSASLGLLLESTAPWLVDLRLVRSVGLSWLPLALGLLGGLAGSLPLHRDRAARTYWVAGIGLAILFVVGLGLRAFQPGAIALAWTGGAPALAWFWWSLLAGLRGLLEAPTFEDRFVAQERVGRWLFCVGLLAALAVVGRWIFEPSIGWSGSDAFGLWRLRALVVAATAVVVGSALFARGIGGRRRLRSWLDGVKAGASHPWSIVPLDDRPATEAQCEPLLRLGRYDAMLVCRVDASPYREAQEVAVARLGYRFDVLTAPRARWPRSLVRWSVAAMAFWTPVLLPLVVFVGVAVATTADLFVSVPLFSLFALSLFAAGRWFVRRRRRNLADRMVLWGPEASMSCCLGVVLLCLAWPLWTGVSVDS